LTFQVGTRISTLGSSVFTGCSSLTEISLPSSLRWIEWLYSIEDG
jgi:hypothetical protein